MRSYYLRELSNGGVRASVHRVSRSAFCNLGLKAVLLLLSFLPLALQPLVDLSLFQNCPPLLKDL